jgi:hypothetical protein
MMRQPGPISHLHTRKIREIRAEFPGSGVKVWCIVSPLKARR